MGPRENILKRTVEKFGEHRIFNLLDCKLTVNKEDLNPSFLNLFLIFLRVPPSVRDRVS